MSFLEIVRRTGQRNTSSRALQALLATMIVLMLGAAGGAQAGAAAANTGVTSAVTAVASAPLAPRYPGTIGLDIDLSDLDHKIMSVHQTMPVTPGHLVLLYPQWIPGSHSPIGNVAMVTGLQIKAGGKPLRWVRDAVNVFAFHIDVPAGVTSLTVDFQFVSPLLPTQGRVVMTSDIVHLQFHSVVLYPAGVEASGIMLEPRVRLPNGWQFATALEEAGREANLVRFKPTDLTTLIDSPLMAGSHFRRYDLAPAGTPPVRFNVFTETDEQLAASDKVLAAHRSLVDQGQKLFGAPPFAHYDFLMALTDNIGGIGREHFESTEIVEKPAYLAEVLTSSARSGVVPHEYAHAWNGKFRRPADQFTGNFSEPLQNSLLWVYEGQTSYYGEVLSARAGFRTMEVVRDRLALQVAGIDGRRGRAWRDLQDTVNDEIMAHRSVPRSWPNWQRQLDYYGEAAIMWLGIDARIRAMTNEVKSLDDFSAAFYAVDGKPLRAPLAYRFEDVVAGLNAVVPYDWAALLRARLSAQDARNLLDDFALTGWRLRYTATPNPVTVLNNKENGECEAFYSLGLTVGKNDIIGSVQWDGPAFKAGLTAGATLIAVNGHVYKCPELMAAVAASTNKTTPVELIVKRENRVNVVKVAYDGGVRYPHLERIEGTPDRLTPAFSPR